MIADALKIALPDATDISVDLATIRYTNRKRRQRRMILTPPPAQRALLMFDNSDPDLRPFEFRLPSPAQIVPMRNRPRQPKKENEPPSKRSAKSKSKVDQKSAKGKSKVDQKRPGPRLGRPEGGGKVPPKLGGTLPPLGSLKGGSAAKTGAAAANYTTGRIRRYGLRAMGHT
jgi:hypothetical protein